ncbi:MAG: rod shape-determining protein RodA [Verrucomicrobiota bacterium]
MFGQPTLNTREPRLDWLMVAGLLGLMVFGVLFIYSATMSREGAQNLALWDQLYFKQIIWYGAGVALAAVVCLVDYPILTRWSLVGYWASILLLLSLYIPGVGVDNGWGAKRWIKFPFFQIQPSEFAKMAFILFMAHFLSRPMDELRTPKVFLKALGLMILPFVLILKEPDLGSALVFIPVGLVMMFVAGVPVQFLRRLVGGVTIVVALVMVDVLFAPKNLQFIKLEDYQKQRLLVYFGLDFAPPGATPQERERWEHVRRQKSYNIEQALISVGSGGLTGKGWREGTQNALGYLPRAVAHNDFIFSVLAEESGFVGSMTVLALYTLVLFTGIRIASQARDRLGKIMASGVVALLFSHVFINIGMNIRIMPVTGIPLPLLSYGGSSVLCSLIAAGLLQNIYIHRKSY